MSNKRFERHGIINYELLCRNVIYVHAHASRYVAAFMRSDYTCTRQLNRALRASVNDYLARTVARG